MEKYKVLTLEDMKREANKSTEEKISDLVRGGEIYRAQQLYFQDINEKRKGLIRL